MRKHILSCFVPALLIVISLLGGCSSSNKEGQPASLSTTPGVASPDGNVQAEILSVTIDSPPVVTFRLLDENGSPLDPRTVTGAAGSLRFLIARLKSDGNYENFIRDPDDAALPGAEGPLPARFTTVGPGLYTYTFATDIANAAQTFKGITFVPGDARTHTAAIGIVRNIATSLGGEFQQVKNVYLNFRPDNGPIVSTREIVSTSGCNACHGFIGQKGSPHEGAVREAAVCILCHNPDLTVNGVSFDFKAMVHKIHMGKELSGNVAAIAAGGFGFSSGDRTFATIGHPFLSADGEITGTPVECVKCHTAGRDVNGRAFGRDVDRWKRGLDPAISSATIANCTSCHDRVAFDGSPTVNVADATNVGTPAAPNYAPTLTSVASLPHTGGPAADGSCNACHVSELAGDNAYRRSIVGYHTIFEQSSVFTGLNFEILSVTNATPGNRAMVTFRITDDAGNVISPAGTGGSPPVANSFTLKLGYFTQTDYTNDGMASFGQPLTQALAGATANADGSFTITFGAAIPAEATGTGVVGLEGTRTYNIPATVKKAARNVRTSGDGIQYYFNLATGAQITDPARQRRISVDIDKCNACHGGSLSLHGGNRKNSIQECVICHNPNSTDRSQRPVSPVDGLTEQSINFKDMIHKIHTGDDLEVSKLPLTGGGAGYIIYGRNSSINDFGEVRYPGDRRNCLACHIDALPIVHGLPLPLDALGTTILTGADLNNAAADDNVRTAPMRSTCLACHDTVFAGVHANSQTTLAGEQCVSCHRTGLLFGVDFAHRPPR